MKLLRASCDCGFVTRKARSGYHHDKWWFPLFSKDNGTLSDVLASLPIEDRNRIDQQQVGLYHETPRDDKLARREASAKMKAFDDEIHKSFIERESITLRYQYVSDDAVLFDPPLQSAFRCPDCGNDSLVLDQVHVTAICKADCGHEYEWLDSETAGCPRCGYRPHRFQTEHEPRFADRPRAICWCPCSSSTDAISHVDGYCPKCGELPDEYQVDGVVFCGIHYGRLLPKTLPVVLGRQEVDDLLRCTKYLKHRTFLTTLYATSMRFSEAANLRLADIDSSSDDGVAHLESTASYSLACSCVGPRWRTRHKSRSMEVGLGAPWRSEQ